MVLMPSAKADEESVVQVESEGYNNCKVCFCIVLEGDKSTVIINLSVKVVTSIVAMRGGEDYQKFVNILIPHNHLQADPDGSHFFYSVIFIMRPRVRAC